MMTSGNLYIVATPIGNLQDITLRAIDTLKGVSTIACEDTRVTSVLLNKFDIKSTLIALNEFNEEHTVYKILKLLESQDVALVSDAGTPLISDPGYKLVTAAKKRGTRIIPIPGPSAVISALCASALPTDKFTFLGFLSKSYKKNCELLESYKNLETTIVIYESPHRITKTLEAILNVFGSIEVTIARELTKIHEEFISKNVSELIELYSNKEPKGEIVILFSTKKP